MEEKIEHCLKDLLLKENQVSLPGFGVFVATDIPAMVNAQNNTIYPPRRKVDFTPGTEGNDAKFIQAFARQEKITKDSARTQVEEFVTNQQKRLHKGTPWIIEDIGKFVIDGQNNLNFFPDPVQNFSPQSYGLEGVEVDTEKSRYQPVAIEEPEKEEEEVITPKRKKRSPVLWILLILLLLGGGAYAFLFHTEQGKTMYADLMHKAAPDEKSQNAAANPETTAGQAYQPRTAALQFNDLLAGISQLPAAEELPDTASNPVISEPLPEPPKEQKTIASIINKKEENKKPTPAPQPAKKNPEPAKPAEKKPEPAKTAEKKPEPAASKPQATKTTESKPVVAKNVPKATPVEKEPQSNTAVSKTAEPVEAPAPVVKRGSKITKSPETIYAQYQVVVSEHSSIQQAVDAADPYVKAGYNAAVIRFPDGRFSVSLARSENRATAERHLNSIRNEVFASVKIKEYK